MRSEVNPHLLTKIEGYCELVLLCKEMKIDHTPIVKVTKTEIRRYCKNTTEYCILLARCKELILPLYT